MQSAVPEVRPPATNMSSLPDQAKFTGGDSVLMKSSRTLFKFLPQNNGSFSPDTARTIRFDISSSQFLDLSEARFCATFTAGQAGTALVDGGLGGTISRISILNNSGQLLERIDDYALLQTVLLQCSERARIDAAGLWAEEMFVADPADIPESGPEGDALVNNAPGPYAIGTESLVIDNQNVDQPIPAGSSVTFAGSATEYTLVDGVDNDTTVITISPALTATVADNAAVTFGGFKKYRMDNAVARDLNHKMHGSWFQTRRKKLLPPGIGFRVEIELVASANECMVNTTAAQDNAFTLSNCYFTIPVVSIQSDAFRDSVSRMLSRGFSWSGSTYRRYAQTMAAAGQTNVAVPDKSVALTGLFAIARLTADITGKNSFKNYYRGGNLFQSQYNLQVGSSQYPPYKIEYTPPNDLGTIGLSSCASNWKVSIPMQQIAAILDHGPLSGSENFGKKATSARGAGNPGYGVGFIAVQCGYSQGFGIDTQTPALPVILDVNVTEACTLTMFAQATATFRMTPSNGMLEVKSVI